MRVKGRTQMGVRLQERMDGTSVEARASHKAQCDPVSRGCPQAAYSCMFRWREIQLGALREDCSNGI